MVLIELIEKHEQETDNVTISKEQIIATINKAKLYTHTNNNEILKYIISKFINKITVSNKAIKVVINFDGFINDSKMMSVIKVIISTHSEVYSIDDSQVQ